MVMREGCTDRAFLCRGSFRGWTWLLIWLMGLLSWKCTARERRGLGAEDDVDPVSVAWGMGLLDFPAPRDSELVSRQGSLVPARADTALLDLIFFITVIHFLQELRGCSWSTWWIPRSWSLGNSAGLCATWLTTAFSLMSGMETLCFLLGLLRLNWRYGAFFFVEP